MTTFCVLGDVSVSPALFAIYIGEAEQHIAAMEREMSAIEADVLHPVGADFMRAAHTLASSSRTTGFESVADTSYALEKWLQEIRTDRPLTEREKLERSLNEAVKNEDYEQAAKVRDALRNLDGGKQS